MKFHERLGIKSEPSNPMTLRDVVWTVAWLAFAGWLFWKAVSAGGAW